MDAVPKPSLFGLLYNTVVARTAGLPRRRHGGADWRALASLGLAVLAGLAADPTAALAQQRSTSQPLEVSVGDSVFLALRNNRNIESAYLGRISQRFDLRVAEDKFVPNLDIDSALDLEKFRVLEGPDILASNASAAPTVSVLAPTGAFFAFSWINSATKAYQPRDLPDIYSTRFDLGVTQPLLRDGGVAVNTASVTLARLSEDANQLQLKSTVINTITSVVQAHRAVLLAGGQVNIARQSLQRARQLLEVNLALVAAGRLAEIEIVQAESNISAQELALLTAENAEDAARLRLLDLLDIDPRTQIEPVDQIVAEEVSLDFDTLFEIALEDRPDYQQALISIEAAKINLLVAQNNRLWDLDATAGVSVRSIAPTVAETRRRLDFKNPDWRIGLALNIPIGDLTREQGEINARVALQQTELGTADLHDSIELAVRDGVRDVASQWRQLEQAGLSRELDQQKLDVERQKLNIGRSSNFQVVTFENDLANSENSELSATINYLNALTRLDQTLGTTLETWQIELHD